MEPWQSWAVVAVGAGAAYYYYNAKNNTKAPQAATANTAERSRARPSRKKEEQRPKGKDQGVSVQKQSLQDQPKSATLSSKNASSEEQVRRWNPGKTPGEETTSRITAQQKGKSEETGEMNDLDFARSLSSAKIGTSLKSSTKSDLPRKSLKQNAASLVPSMSSTPSNSGVDADDGTSSAASPKLHASKSNKNSKGVDVSDMLEPSPAGPSVLKVKESNDPKQEKNPKQKKDVQSQETKKQRQNRRKAEENKVQREEQEKERLASLEKQRRTAREARGEPAKNGLGNVSSLGDSVWKTSGGSASTSANKAELPASVALLDTYDANGSSNSGPNGSNGYRGSSANTKAEWENSIPSEEDQLRLIKEQDESNWNTVGKKSKKKTAPPSNGHTTGNESSDAGPREKPATKVSQLPKKVNGANGSHDTVNSFGSFNLKGKSHPNDSDWAVV